jgi:hypothetical protein
MRCTKDTSDNCTHSLQQKPVPPNPEKIQSRGAQAALSARSKAESEQKKAGAKKVPRVRPT